MLICCCSGCKKGSPSVVGTMPNSEIVPLSIGNRWFQHCQLYDSSGNVFSSWPDSICVLGDSVIGNTSWFLLEMQGLEYEVNNQQGGLWSLGEGGQFLWYKYPAEKGDSFLVSTNTSFVRVCSVDTMITVKAGTFSCYRYEFDIPPWSGAIGGARSVEFLSPDHGFIEKEFYQSTFTSSRQYLYSRVELNLLGLK